MSYGKAEEQLCLQYKQHNYSLQQLVRRYNATLSSHFLFHYESMIQLLKLKGKLISMIIFSKYRLKIQNKHKRSALRAH